MGPKHAPPENGSTQSQSVHRIRSNIMQALAHDGFLTKAEAQEAAFHLTDWITELNELNELFSVPRWDTTHAQQVLMSFVVHAQAHLVAAHRIIAGAPVTDVFELGAVKGSGRAKRRPGARFTSSKVNPASRKRK
jgi:hypothetical protein